MDGRGRVTFRDNEKTAERMMDSNDLEKERGITILAKTTSVASIGAAFMARLRATMMEASC